MTIRLRVAASCLVAALFSGCGSDPKSGAAGSAPRDLVGGKPGPAIQALPAEYLEPGVAKAPDSAPALVAFLSAPGGPAPSRMAIEGLEDAASALAFTPDSRFLVTASYNDFSLRVWNVADGKQVAS